MQQQPREALFISHATPEDNPFTIWLGAKLAALGYEVWADVMRLRGGDDWSRKLEDALRNRACKVLLVANARAVEKQGVRNEINIASEVGRRLGDNAFIIPLRLDPFDAPFLIAHAQYIDFQRGWALGLRELLETLEETYNVPRQAGAGTDVWRDLQLLHAREPVPQPEPLVSNWLRINGLPSSMRYFDFKSGVSHSRVEAAVANAPLPAIRYMRGLLSFARLDELQEHFGPDLPLIIKAERATEILLDEGWPDVALSAHEARKSFSNLGRQALERFFRMRGLEAYALTGRTQAWWPSESVAPKGKVPFRWANLAGLRQITGRSDKRNMHWHFGISVAVRTAPMRHVRVTSRLIFSEDGVKPFADAARMHRLRRSFAKTWRNARWRDMLLAYLSWLAEGGDELRIPVGGDEPLRLALPPMVWEAPVSMPIEEEAPDPDEDDPGDAEEIADEEELASDPQERADD